jgi:hypothetical protein
MASSHWLVDFHYQPRQPGRLTAGPKVHSGRVESHSPVHAKWHEHAPPGHDHGPLAPYHVPHAVMQGRWSRLFPTALEAMEALREDIVGRGIGQDGVLVQAIRADGRG